MASPFAHPHTTQKVAEIAHPAVRGQLCGFIAVGRGLGQLCAGLLTFGFSSAARGNGWRVVHIW